MALCTVYANQYCIVFGRLLEAMSLMGLGQQNHLQQALNILTKVHVHVHSGYYEHMYYT